MTDLNSEPPFGPSNDRSISWTKILGVIVAPVAIIGFLILTPIYFVVAKLCPSLILLRRSARATIQSDIALLELSATGPTEAALNEACARIESDKGNSLTSRIIFTSVDAGSYGPEVLRALRQMLARDPHDWIAAYHLAQALVGSGLVPEAREICNRMALEADPGWSQWARWRLSELPDAATTPDA